MYKATGFMEARASGPPCTAAAVAGTAMYLQEKKIQNPLKTYL
jgi:hypothetical protein